MAWYPARGGGIPASVKTDMNAVLNKKFGTSAQTYPPTEWADDVNLMGLLPIRTASGTIAHFEDGADSVPMKSVVANIVPIQEGTGTPSPSNHRPISGTDELTLTRTGKNLNGFTLADFQGGIVVGNARFIGIKIPKSTITYSSNAPTGNIWVARDFTDITTANNRVFDGSPVTYDNVEWLCIGLQKDNMETAFAYSTQAELGNTATDFETYTGTTYTFDLGQEIMGGTADVVGGVGSKTKEKITVNGSEAWQVIASGANKRYTLTLSDYTPNNAEISDIFQYLPTTIGNFGTFYFAQGILRIPDGNDTFATLEDFKQWLSENTPSFVLQRTTPMDFTFTGQPINSYLGTNNLYTDSGEVLEVDYRADIDLLIAELEGNRGLQMMRATPTEENDEQEETENEGER